MAVTLAIDDVVLPPTGTFVRVLTDLDRCGYRTIPIVALSLLRVLEQDAHANVIRNWLSALPSEVSRVHVGWAGVLDEIVTETGAALSPILDAIGAAAGNAAASGAECLFVEGIVSSTSIGRIWLPARDPRSARAIIRRSHKWSWMPPGVDLPPSIVRLIHRAAHELAPCRLDVVLDPLSDELYVRRAWLIHATSPDEHLVHFSDTQPRRTMRVSNREALVPIASLQGLGGHVATGRLAVGDLAPGSRDPAILFLESPLPRHVRLISKSVGVMVQRAGPATHTVVVARGLGKPVAITPTAVLEPAGGVRVGEHVVREGDWLTIDEQTGQVFRGRGEIERSTSQRDAPRTQPAATYVNADDAGTCEIGLASGAVGVGLCRSENCAQSPSDLWAIVAVTLATEDEAPRAWDRFRRLVREQVTSLLESLRGRPLHYRLLDISVRDVATTADASDIAKWTRLSLEECAQRLATALRSSDIADHRGPRVGILNGIYAAQVEAILSAVDDASRSTQMPDAVIVVPLVGTIDELREVKMLIATTPRRSASPVRLGAMLETPRAAFLAAGCASEADVLCFGTNDLTQFVCAADRVHGSKWITPYLDKQFLDSDPFAEVDPPVLDLIRRAVRRARLVKPEIPILVCGDHASSAHNVEQLLAADVTGVSCRPDVVEDIVHVHPRRNVTSLSVVLPRPTAVVRGQTALERIRAALGRGDPSSAQHAALDWALNVSRDVGLEPLENWKFFKRDVAALWFGQRVFKRFWPPWSAHDVAEAVAAWIAAGEVVRFSSFPRDIACHAVSDTFAAEYDRADIDEKLAGIDSDSPIEVFPQQRPDRLCFRIVINDGGARIEMGEGQAMYVFEVERGRHPTLQADLLAYLDRTQMHSDAPRSALSEGLDALLRTHGAELFARIVDCACILGLPWLAIEGYFDARDGGFPVVCDIDLPHDIAFHS